VLEDMNIKKVLGRHHFIANVLFFLIISVVIVSFQTVPWAQVILCLVIQSVFAVMIATNPYTAKLEYANNTVNHTVFSALLVCMVIGHSFMSTSEEIFAEKEETLGTVMIFIFLIGLVYNITSQVIYIMMVVRESIKEKSCFRLKGMWRRKNRIATTGMMVISSGLDSGARV
jgi:hypothetical protein